MKASDLIKLARDPLQSEKSGIYIIYNINTEKAYIGQSKDVINRIYKHRTLLNRNAHPNPHLQNSFNFYGKKAFVFLFLEAQEDSAKLSEREKFYIDLLEEEYRYNCQNIPNRTYSISEETRKKQSLAHLGKVLPDEQKEKISAALKGRQPSENTIAASRAKKGRPLSEEHKKALSLAKKGKRSSRASISDDLARQIYLEKKKTNKTCLEIAKENRVSLDIVKHITNPNSKSWTHIRG